MKNICDSCLGCEIPKELKKKSECKYYVNSNSTNWTAIIGALIFLTIIGLSIYGFFIWFSRLAGG